MTIPSSGGERPHLDQLRTFLAIYRSGSLTAASRITGLSQPAVSAQLRAVESALGRQLFERVPRGVIPTRDATELAMQAAPGLDLLESAMASTGAHAGSTPPVLVGGPAEFLTAVLLPRLAPLASDGIRLEVTFGLAQELLASLRAGALDLVVSSVKPRGKGFDFEPFAFEEFVLVMSPQWAEGVEADRLAARDPLALAHVPLATYDADAPIVRRYWRHYLGSDFQRHPEFIAPDLRAVLSFVIGGGGFSVLPEYLCRQALNEGVIVELAGGEDVPGNTGYLVLNRPDFRSYREACPAGAGWPDSWSA